MLKDEITAYLKKDYYPFHMPGHKRQNDLVQSSLFPYDVTELEETDNLFHATGIIKKAIDYATETYQTTNTFFSVNGSSACMLAAICACTAIGDSILVARNAHISVLNAITIRNLKVDYLSPKVIDNLCINAEITAEEVDKALDENEQCKVVVIVSPTYEGILSDIQAISRVVHQHHAILIVDEAHGAHLPFKNDSAITRGADIVIHSLHKTLPAPNQTALLHYCAYEHHSSELPEKIAFFMKAYQTTSPSYPLLMAIDECIHKMSRDGTKLLAQLEKRLAYVQEVVKELIWIGILNSEVIPCKRDESKIILYTKENRESGAWLGKKLRENGIEVEMCSAFYVNLYATVGDTEKGIEKLIRALKEIDKTLDDSTATENKMRSEVIKVSTYVGEQVFTPYEASQKRGQFVLLEDAVGKVAHKEIMLYPPGIALLVPGERIDEEHLMGIQCYLEENYDIIGVSADKKINVVMDEE